jgi:5'-deoxynucleotidase YfbR-like HD superfamily hydrolase
MANSNQCPGCTGTLSSHDSMCPWVEEREWAKLHETAKPPPGARVNVPPSWHGTTKAFEAEIAAGRVSGALYSYATAPATAPPVGVKGSTICLSTGRYFDFNDPGPLTIEEVAHALSHICRFTGHCKTFYSVAQHSVLVSHLVPRELAMHGLLHDAVETVVGDMSSPLKHLIPAYRVIEDRCEAAILAGFGMAMPWRAEVRQAVKQADLQALRTEQRDQMHADGHLWSWTSHIEPAKAKVVPLPPEYARQLFLARYEELTMGGAK